MAHATSAAAGVTRVAAAMPARKQRRAECRGLGGRDAARWDRPFRPFARVDLAVKDVVAHDPARVETGGRDDERGERATVFRADDGESGQDIGERRRHVRRTRQFDERARATLHGWPARMLTPAEGGCARHVRPTTARGGHTSRRATTSGREFYRKELVGGRRG